MNLPMQVIYTFPKNRHEQVKAYFQAYKGSNLVHLRVFDTAADGTEQPTTKGIALRINQLPQLHEAVEALVAAQEASSR